jgi:hypothetical protein
MKSFISFRLFVLFLAIFFYTQSGWAQRSCEEIKVTVEIFPTSEGKDNGKIQLKFNSNESLFHIHLFQAGHETKLKLNKKDIENLKKGTYRIVITGKNEDSVYCPKQFEVNIN